MSPDPIAHAGHARCFRAALFLKLSRGGYWTGRRPRETRNRTLKASFFRDGLGLGIDAFRNAGRFAAPVAQIVELGATDFAATHG